MLQLQIIGNLTRDAEIRQSQKTQDNFLTFTIAVNEGKDKPAIFIRCLRRAYDNTQNLMQYMTKGKKVYVQGKPSVGIYNDRENNTIRPDITCFVEHIELLSGNNEAATGTQDSAPAENPAPNEVSATTVAATATTQPKPVAPATQTTAAFEDDGTDLPF